MKPIVTLLFIIAATGSGVPVARASEPGAVERIFSSTALVTPYRESLTAVERVAGLSLVWSEAKYNFANFDLVPGLDWDAVYLEYLEQVLPEQSSDSYYRVLQSFIAQLRDGHSNVYPPSELHARFWTRPPLYTRLIDGEVIIYLVTSRTLAEMGLAAGQKITHIDGMPVHEYAAARVRPYQSASTQQDLDVRTYNYGLLAGPDTGSVRLRTKSLDGRVLDVEIPRSGYPADDRIGPVPRAISMQWLDNDIALVDVRSFESEEVAGAFIKMMPEIRARAKGLVLDLRLNGGGDTLVGWRILAQLTDRLLPASRWKTRLYRPVFRAWQHEEAWAWDEADPGTYTFDVDGVFDEPVVVLTSARTYSAAEDFLVPFRMLDRGLVIGQATGGSTGQPLHFQLPGGGKARVTSKRDWMPDGTEFVGTGFPPDIVVEPRREDIARGRDPELDRAVSELRRLLE